jgi:hypothetical protein
MYFKGNKVLEVGLMTTDMNGQMTTTGVDTDTYTLQFRAPNAQEQKDLNAQSAKLMYKAAWLVRTDVAIEVSYTIKNLDKMPATAHIEINGADEFTNYDPTLILGALAANVMGQNKENQPVVLPLFTGVPVMIAPGQSYSGLVREDDFAESELDLDAIGRWMAVADSVLINRSEVNPIGLDMMPKNESIPAMFRIAVSFYGDQHLTCEYVIRVRDHNDRLWFGPGSGALYKPTPMDYTPPPPMMMP